MEFMGREAAPTTRVMGVSELNKRVARLLDLKVPELWVEGEVSRPTRASSGHVYFALKDSQSRVDAVIWAADAVRLPFRLEEGQQVRARGRVTLYAPQGRYQIVCSQIEASGEGALRAALLALRNKLAAEGLLDEDRKRPLPFLPRAVGLITSPIGAAVQDVCSMIFQRFPRMRVVLCPVKVQGVGSKEEVARAIVRMNGRHDVDVLIVGRGGGSLEDLWTFNEEVVVRAIAESRLPIVSAVGHEIDVTLSDLVADFRALTPTKAGEAVVPDERELREDLTDRLRRLDVAIQRGLVQASRRVDELARRSAFRLLPRRIAEERQGLDGLELRLVRAASRAVTARRERLMSLASRLAAQPPHRWITERRRLVAGLSARLLNSDPRSRIAEHRRGLAQTDIRLLSATRSRVTRVKGRLEPLGRALTALNPVAVMERGFSITRVMRDGGYVIVRDANDVADGDSMVTTVSLGDELISRVVEHRERALPHPTDGARPGDDEKHHGIEGNDHGG